MLAPNVGVELGRASGELDVMRQESPQQEQALREARPELESTYAARND